VADCTRKRKEHPLLAAKTEAPKSTSVKPAEKTPNHTPTPLKDAFDPAWMRLTWGIQPKLAVSTPDDLYEREADRLADHVLRMGEPQIQRACAACSSGGVPCPKCEEERKVSRRADCALGPTAVPDDFASQLGTGSSLEPDVRAFFEPRYGANFRDVRVHVDERADAAARSVDALAFTLGQHLVFRGGQYAANTSGGRRLLAHELAHVVQQGSPAGTAEANTTSRAVTEQRTFGATGGRPAQVARQAQISPAPPASGPAPEPEPKVIDDAFGRATLLTMDAKARIDRLRDLVSTGKLDQATKEDAHTLKALQKWLHLDVTKDRAGFVTAVDSLTSIMTSNISMAKNPSRHTTPDPCPTLPGSIAWAKPGDSNAVITYCDTFFKKGPQCQRNVILHERYHLAGAQKDDRGRIVPQANATTAQALDNADDLTDLTKDVMNQEIFVCNTSK
jgi:hypothetical protein